MSLGGGELDLGSDDVAMFRCNTGGNKRVRIATLQRFVGLSHSTHVGLGLGGLGSATTVLWPLLFTGGQNASRRTVSTVLVLVLAAVATANHPPATMAAHICSSSPPSDLGGGAAFACQWQASRRGDWYEGEGEGGVDDETGHHHRWAQPAQSSAVAQACPLPCKGTLTERGGRDTAPWANTHTQPHTCDETAHSDSGALYIPPKNYLGIGTVTSAPNAFGYATGTVVGGSFDNTIAASGVDSAPAPFSLARELAPARPARPRPKGVTIGQFSVVRVCVCGEAEGFVSSDSTDEEKDVSLNRRDDICSPTLTEDGPREESLLLDRYKHPPPPLEAK